MNFRAEFDGMFWAVGFGTSSHVYLDAWGRVDHVQSPAQDRQFRYSAVAAVLEAVRLVMAEIAPPYGAMGSEARQVFCARVAETATALAEDEIRRLAAE